MSDLIEVKTLVERLREEAKYFIGDSVDPQVAPLMQEAADRIERLMVALVIIRDHSLEDNYLHKVADKALKGDPHEPC